MSISPHVARLRSLVGTELLQLPSVAVLPVNPSGKVLLVRHADTGLWGVLGGALELDVVEAECAQVQLVEDRRRGEQGVVAAADVDACAEGVVGRRTAADARERLEHDDSQPRAGEVRGADEPVVPAADDDRVGVIAPAGRGIGPDRAVRNVEIGR